MYVLTMAFCMSRGIERSSVGRMFSVSTPVGVSGGCVRWCEGMCLVFRAECLFWTCMFSGSNVSV